MKKMLILTVAMLLIAGVAYAGVSSSKHDMRSYLNEGAGGYNEICVYCHTPHSAAKTGGTAVLPLWNRSYNTGATYTPYSSSTMNATMPTTLSGASGACMTCHDGTIAVSALYNIPNDTTGAPTAGVGNVNAAMKLNAGPAAFSTDLSDDHPVGITFMEGAGTEMNALATVQASSNVRLFGGSTDQVECASCHNVHSFTYTPFLRSTNAGSAMCLTCHAK